MITIPPGASCPFSHRDSLAILFQQPPDTPTLTSTPAHVQTHPRAHTHPQAGLCVHTRPPPLPQPIQTPATFLGFLLFPASQESRDEFTLVTRWSVFHTRARVTLNEDTQTLRPGFLKTLQSLPLQLEEIQIEPWLKRPPALYGPWGQGRGWTPFRARTAL